MGRERIDDQSTCSDQFKRGRLIGLMRPPAGGRIMSGPRAFVRAQNGQPLLMHITIEIYRLRLSASTAQEDHPPAETGQIKGGGDGFGMAGCFDDVAWPAVRRGRNR